MVSQSAYVKAKQLRMFVLGYFACHLLCYKSMYCGWKLEPAIMKYKCSGHEKRELVTIVKCTSYLYSCYYRLMSFTLCRNGSLNKVTFLLES